MFFLVIHEPYSICVVSCPRHLRFVHVFERFHVLFDSFLVWCCRWLATIFNYFAWFSWFFMVFHGFWCFLKSPTPLTHNTVCILIAYRWRYHFKQSKFSVLSVHKLEKYDVMSCIFYFAHIRDIFWTLSIFMIFWHAKK